MERFRPYIATSIWLVAGALFLSGCSGSASGGNGADGVVDRGTDTGSPADGSDSGTPPADDDNTAEPTAQLSASDDVVGSGDDVVLTWSSSRADSCQASGGWSGARAASGSATVGPVTESTTFTLTCSGSGGNAVAMISVSVLGVVTLSWQAPTENVDGTPLTDLAGYRIYYGEESRVYDAEVQVSGGNVTVQDVALPSGSYYFAMTAMDADGNESAYSNEVVKVVN